MKRDYMTKKKITIATLSMVAICLAGGLFYYVGTMKNDTPIVDTQPPIQTEENIVVPKIENPAITTPDKVVEDDTDSTESEKSDDTTDESIANESTDNVIETNPVNPSDDDKPKTKDEATPPTDNTPPEINENGEDIPKVVEPNKPADNAPKDGDIKDGYIYIEGFGWIENHGGGSDVQDGAFDITGEKVGDM